MRPMLSVPQGVEEKVVRDRGLCVEARPDLDNPVPAAMRDLVLSAHAPWFMPDAPVPQTRIHLACTDRAFRQRSIEVVERYIEGACKLYPNVRTIVTHNAPHYFPFPPVRPQPNEPVPPFRPDLADRQLLLDSLRHLARRCQALGVELVVENNWAYWEGVAPGADVTQLGPGDFLEYFDIAPQDWLALPHAVGETHLSLCLDPSHAGPYCHRWPDVPQRRQVMAQYVSQPERIGHIHWNDSDLTDDRGRNDLHLCVGTGTLGDDFHAALKTRATQLDHPVTLEHFRDVVSLDKELAYIDSL
ncbi:MAG TPA: TIM barrel protein [Phycisphaerae bacterium]|nr:TIM barrel protein [Phycisphaerae bacterium]